MRLLTALFASEQDDWMHQCVPDMMNKGHEQDQAVAICISMYERGDTSSRAERLAATLKRFNGGLAER